MIEQALQNDVISWAPALPTPPVTPGIVYEAYPPAYRDEYLGRPGDHQSLARLASSQYLWWNDLVLHYLLTGDRRVVDLLSQVPSWRGFQVPVGTNSGEAIYAPVVLGSTRPTAISLTSLLHAYQVLGCESVIASRGGASYVVPAWRAGYPSPLSCAVDGPADRMFRGLRTVFRYLKGQDQAPAVPGTPASFDAATLDPMTWPNWSAAAPPQQLYDQTSFFADYPATAFHYYYQMTGDPSAREALGRVAAMQRAEQMPSGVVQYHRHNLSTAPGESPLQRLMVGAHEVSAIPAFAYLDSIDPSAPGGVLSYLKQGEATLDWLLHYEGVGAFFAGMDADVAWLQHARRRAGPSEASLLTTAVPQSARTLMQTEAAQFDSAPARERCFLVLEVARLKNENEAGACAALAWLTATPTRFANLNTHCGDVLPTFRDNLCAMRPSPTACPCP